MGRRSLFLTALLAAICSHWSLAEAQDQSAVRRLTKHGNLSAGAAKGLANDVSERMKRAAGMTNTNDPLRMAVSQALFGTPVPGNQMAAAKVRLRLYAGLNDWALDNIFKAQPGAIGSCQRALQLAPNQCAALVAAGGRTTLADAQRRGGGAAPAAGGYGARPQQGFGQRPAFGQQPRPAYGQQPRPAYGQRPPMQQPRPAYGQPPPVQQPAPRPMARPTQQPAPRPMARPAAPRQPQMSAAERKAAYKRKREEYLERKRQEMEARKAKVVATAGGTERADRGPTSAAEAEAAGLPAPKPAPSATASAAPAAAEPEPAAAPAPKKKAKPTLDEGFLGDLLADPLGGGGK